jgi:hypothetical protein
MPNIMANLYRAYRVGDVLNYEGGVYRVVRETGLSLDNLPGGSGVREVELEYIQPGPVTADVLLRLERT